MSVDKFYKELREVCLKYKDEFNINLEKHTAKPENDYVMGDPMKISRPLYTISLLAFSNERVE